MFCRLRNRHSQAPGNGVAPEVSQTRLLSGRPTVSLIVSGIKLTVLVDTGASVSLLRRNVLDQIIPKTHRVHVLEKSGPLQGLGGMYLKGCGKTLISRWYSLPSRSCRLRHTAA